MVAGRAREQPQHEAPGRKTRALSEVIGRHDLTSVVRRESYVGLCVVLLHISNAVDRLGYVSLIENMVSSTVLLDLYLNSGGGKRWS